MKNSSLFIIALFSTIYSANADTEKTLASNIKHVTVFLNKAQITRAAKTTVDAGLTNLVFDNLSAYIDKQSIQASGKGGIVIMSVQHKVNYLDQQKKTPKLIKLEDSLRYYQRELEQYANVVDVLTKEEIMILKNQAIGGQDNGVSIAELQRAADFFRTRLTDIRNRRLKNDRKMQKINKRVVKINSQLNELNKRRNQPTGEILVSVSAKAKTTATLELNYLVQNAGWVPIYDLRAKDTRSPIQLSYKANVWQNTGVDWNKVKFTLSTANPAQGGTKPSLAAWYVDFYTPVVISYQKKGKMKPQSRSFPAPAASSRADYAVTLEEMEKAESIADFTQVTESSVATEFKIALPYSVSSDGKPKLIDIQKYELSAGYKHFAIPKMDKDAFLVAEVTGWEEYNLLSGKANIYFEGTYVAESILDVQNIRDTLDISLGRDKKVIIKREKIKDLTKRRVIGTNIKETFAYELSVRNIKRDLIEITIEDQAPVSKQSQIEVELIESSGAVYNKNTGKLTWKLALKPAETKKVLFKFSVKYPKGKTVSQL
ncbi:MAG: DUF4139 domain-containing protein [Cytophagales bacterium]|nr:DUF4139 domain-containing protein [Cytophagales bacterium]